MTTQRLFRSSAIALLALIARSAAAWGQQPALRDNPPAGAVPPVKMMYDGDAKTGYSVSNSDKLLKVRLWVADPKQQRKILENGLELWIDTRGKKNKKTGILYPLPARPAGNVAKTDHPGEAAANEAHSLPSLVAGQKEIKLVGFSEDLNGVQNQHHLSGIDVSLRIINDTLFYDAQVPLPLLPGLAADNARLGIGIIEKGKDPSLFPGGDMPGGGPPGGGDGMGPGGPPPGNGPAPETDIDQFANNVIWYKFSIYR